MQQVLRGDRRSDAGAGTADERDGCTGRDVFKHHAQPRVTLRHRCEDVVDETLLAIEHIDMLVRELAVDLQHHAELGHACQHIIDVSYIGDA